VNIFGFSGLALALIAAAIAVVPAIVVFVRGRQIARFADDPALPERLAAGRNVTSASFAFTATVLIIITGSAAIWAIPLSVIAYLAAGLPLRRLLYNETWSLAFYISFVIRFFIAVWTFWLLTCALPALALWAGERSWIVALAMGGMLMILASHQTEVFRWLIDAKPIQDATIRARFDQLVGACGIAAPHFEAIDLKGGTVVNAFALPSLGRPAVVFTAPLLQRLDADEVDGICAHELAHLEHYNPRRMRQRRLISQSLVLGGALLTPLLQYLIPSLASLACVAWPAVVLITLLVLVRDRQKHETASDLRAVALTGNPEALVRALVKLHAIARIPRRWDVDFERHMSHPSLKRRIQDIRGAVGTPVPSLDNAAGFESSDGTARVIFSSEGLEWHEGESASYRVRYDRLKDLRIVADRTGEAKLLASDGTGHRWQMPLRRDDVPRMQAVLDIVEARIITPLPTATVQPLLIRAATLTMLIVSIDSGLLAVAIVLATTLARPDTPLLSAAGVAAVAGTALMWRNSESMYGFIPAGFEATFAAVLVLGGALLLWLAYARRRDEVPVPAWKLTHVMAVAAVASWVLPTMIVGSGFDAIGFHQAAREWPSTVVFPLALAGALAWSTRKLLRIASAVAIVAGVAAAAVGSQTFVDRFGQDVFLVSAPDVKLRNLNHPVKEFTVPFGLSDLQLSPSGRSIAALTRRQDGRTLIHIGRTSEALTPIDADGALFIDDDRVFLWTVDGSRTDLREVLVTAPEAATWRLHVTGLSFPTASLDAKARRWRLASHGGTRVVEAREGVIGSDQIDSYRWSVPEGHGSPFMPIAMSGDRALVIEPRSDLGASLSNPFNAFLFVLASSRRWPSTIWALGPDGAKDIGTSRLELECRLLPHAGHGACHIFDASRTRFFAIDAMTRRITPVGTLPGRFYAGEEPQGGWVTGWYQSDLIAVRTGPVDAIRIDGPDGGGAHILAASEHAAAGVWYQVPAAASSRIAPIDEATGISVIRVYAIDSAERVSGASAQIEGSRTADKSAELAVKTFSLSLTLPSFRP
jgi:heat shock protein HtpX